MAVLKNAWTLEVVSEKTKDDGKGSLVFATMLELAAHCGSAERLV